MTVSFSRHSLTVHLLIELKIDQDTLSARHITTCAMSKDGRLIAIGDNAGNVSIWGVPAMVP